MNWRNWVSAGRLLPFLCAALAYSVNVPAETTEIYKWTDENGVINFSTTKPVKRDFETIDFDDNPGGPPYPDPVAPGPATDQATIENQPESAAQRIRQDIARSRDQKNQAQQEISLMCEKHERRLEQMEPARRVYYTDENGNEVRMDDIQRVTLIEESRNYIAENCH